MARDKREPRRGAKDAPRKGKKKVCVFCTEHIAWVDYKDVNLLRRFMSERGKIRARRVTGNCQQHQRDVAVAIKTARELALLPYTQRTMSERGPGRGGGRGRRGEEQPLVGTRDGAADEMEEIDDVDDGASDVDGAGIDGEPGE